MAVRFASVMAFQHATKFLIDRWLKRSPPSAISRLFFDVTRLSLLLVMIRDNNISLVQPHGPGVADGAGKHSKAVAQEVLCGRADLTGAATPPMLAAVPRGVLAG